MTIFGNAPVCREFAGVVEVSDSKYEIPTKVKIKRNTSYAML
jgi:hypothetical protein